jgi:hypothetical protein
LLIELPLLFSTRGRESCPPGIVGKPLPIYGRSIDTGSRENRNGRPVHMPPMPCPNYEADLNCFFYFDAQVDFVARH